MTVRSLFWLFASALLLAACARPVAQFSVEGEQKVLEQIGRAHV